MKKGKENSNWSTVLTIALLFIIVGTIAFLLQNNYEKNKPKDNETIEKETKEEQKPDNEQEEDKVEDKKEEEKVEYKEQEKFKNQEGETVKIKGDKIVSATGFAGASNYKFYLKDGNLYFKNISTDTEEELIATGVKDLYLENKEVTAELEENGKIVKENNYVIYK